MRWVGYAMHDCQKYREDLSDLVLHTKSTNADAVLPFELRSCDECMNFYRDAVLLGEILSDDTLAAELPDEYWVHFEDRLRRNLMDRGQDPRSPVGTLFGRGHASALRWAAMASAAAVIAAAAWLPFAAVDGLNVK